MNRSMNPGRWMIPANLVDRDPLVLEQPVSNQVNHESLLKNGQVHAGFLGGKVALLSPFNNPTEGQRLRLPACTAEKPETQRGVDWVLNAISRAGV